MITSWIYALSGLAASIFCVIATIFTTQNVTSLRLTLFSSFLICVVKAPEIFNLYKSRQRFAVWFDSLLVSTTLLMMLGFSYYSGGYSFGKNTAVCTISTLYCAAKFFALSIHSDNQTIYVKQ